MSTNNNLNKAKDVKNDEFYTRYEDIEKEVLLYKDFFKDKYVLCPCDMNVEDAPIEYHNKKWFGFSKFFNKYKDLLGIKEVFYTHFNVFKNDGLSFQESIPLFAETLGEDLIIVTNPPFSQFREFVDTLIKYNVKFLFIGSNTGMKTKKCFEYYMEGKIDFGENHLKHFYTDGEDKRVMAVWYTNMFRANRYVKPLNNKRSYYADPSYYQFLDNYYILNVNELKDIPYDYEGFMGVPISFLYSHKKEDFKIYGILNSPRQAKCELGVAPSINGKKLFPRILIKHRKYVSDEY